MSNLNEAPRNVQDAIYLNLQALLLPAKLNPDAVQNVNVLLRWASEEFFTKKTFTENAAPEVIGNVLLARVKASPKSLVWDSEPDFTPAAPALTAEDITKQVEEFTAKEMKRIMREKLDNDPKKFEERKKKIEADKKAAEDAKSAEIAKVERRNSILTYEAYRGPNRRDSARTEEVQKALSTITYKNADGSINEVETTRVVLQVLNRLPDDAKAASVWKVVEEIKRDRAAAAAKPVRRDSLGDY